jgi:riboflavin synthase
MFTGLVADTGLLRAVERSADGARLEVETELGAELARGDSIAIDGVCLTAVEANAGRLRADVMAETLARSTLGALEPGDRVNLELPLRAADRLGGHLVQGHVDGVGVVESIADEGLARRVEIRAGGEVCRYVVEKGSVALDGVSLTAISADDERFAVALIPETLERTTLRELAPGDAVNVEVDVVAKYVEKLLPGAREPESLTEASR